MPIALRADFDAAKVRQEAKRSRDAAQARRLLALATIYDGASRTEAAIRQRLGQRGDGELLLFAQNRADSA